MCLTGVSLVKFQPCFLSGQPHPSQEVLTQGICLLTLSLTSLPLPFLFWGSEWVRGERSSVLISHFSQSQWHYCQATLHLRKVLTTEQNDQKSMDALNSRSWNKKSQLEVLRESNVSVKLNCRARESLACLFGQAAQSVIVKGWKATRVSFKQSKNDKWVDLIVWQTKASPLTTPQSH